MLIYKPTLDTLEFKALIMFLTENQEVFTPKLKPLYTGFLHSIRFTGYKLGIIVDKDPLVIYQND